MRGLRDGQGDRLMTGTTSVTSTGNKYVDGLLYGAKWAGAITFAFPDSPTDYEAGYGAGEPLSAFAQVSVADMQAVRAILTGAPQAGGGGNAVLRGLGVTDLTSLRITDAGTDGADLRIAQSSKPSTAYAYLPGQGVGGDVWLGTAYAGTIYDYRNPVLGNYAYMTIAHELGHALGLKHSQEAGGVANTAVPSDKDDIEFTIMSYRSYIGGPISGYTFEQWGAPQSYMMLDIAALQQMYGANFATRGGDTTYRWDPTSGQMYVDGVGQGQPGANRIFLTLWDGGGHDTYDLSNYLNGVNVNLTPGGWSTFSAAQLAYLGGGHYARANVFNALLYNGDTRSLIEDAIGGAGNDTLTGNQADNHLWGGDGNDSLVGGAGNDTLEGGAGLDTLYGGTGNDLYVVTSSGDLVREDLNAGNDTVMAAANWVLGANIEDLVLTGSADINGTGNALANHIIGNGGNNSLEGGGGLDTLAGGAGNDNYLVAVAGVVVIENPNEGIDLVRASVTYALPENVENLTLIGTGAINGFGNGLDNVILGNAAANRLDGGDGNDSLDGGAGNDTLVGGSGDNTLAGGLGNDVYIVSSATDLLREDAAAGTDLVQASVSWTLGANFENLTLTGTADLNGAGNALNNVITGNAGANSLSGDAGNDTLIGNAGNDTLDGGAGNDSMAGGSGDDIYYVDSATDIVSELSGAGTDLVIASVSYTLTANVENLTLGGTGNINGSGNTLTNVLTGNAGNNLLNGAGGADTIMGGDGNDTLIGGAGADGLAGGAGLDAFRWNASTEGGDTIADFTAGEDWLEFKAAGFGLVAGSDVAATGHLAMNDAGSAIGAVAQFIYNTLSHWLYWDSNGSGTGGVVALAWFQNGATLSGADFHVIA